MSDREENRKKSTGSKEREQREVGQKGEAGCKS